MKKIHTGVLVCVLAAIGASERPTWAQSAPGPGPERGAAGVRPLDITLWGGAGDQGVVGSTPIDLGPAVRRHSQEQIGIRTKYIGTRRRLLFTVDYVSRARVDSTLSQGWAFDHDATLSAKYDVTRRTRVGVAQRVGFLPLDVFTATSGPTIATGSDGFLSLVDSRLATRQTLTATTNLIATHELTRRSSLVFTQELTRTGSVGSGTLHGRMTGIRLDRRVTSRGTLRLGYRWGAVAYGQLRHGLLSVHDVDVGFDYARSLPFSPRTTVTASTGSSVIGESSARSFRLLANVAAVHTFSRRWRARVEYGRPVQYFGGLAAPVISDVVGAALTSDVGRHSSVHAFATFSSGAAGYGSGGNAAKTRTTGLQWQAALGRRVGLQTDAFYGRSRFGPEVKLPSGVPAEFDWVGMHVAMTYALSGFRD